MFSANDPDPATATWTGKRLFDSRVTLCAGLAQESALEVLVSCVVDVWALLLVDVGAGVLMLAVEEWKSSVAVFVAAVELFIEVLVAMSVVMVSVVEGGFGEMDVVPVIIIAELAMLEALVTIALAVAVGLRSRECVAVVSSFFVAVVLDILLLLVVVVAAAVATVLGAFDAIFVVVLRSFGEAEEIKFFIRPVVVTELLEVDRLRASHPLHVLSHSSTKSPHKPLPKIR